MSILQQIALEVVEILTLVFGILGITFSLLLIFSPGLTKSISVAFNRNVNFDDKVSYLDKDISVDSFIYSHNVIFGICLSAGSAFALIFFFFSLDVSSFANIFFVSGKYVSTNKMIFEAVSWIGKVACFVGLICGIIIIIAPEKMKRIEKVMASWFETRPVFDKLDESKRELDTLFFRHPIVCGTVGLIISVFVIVLSILNLLS
ncbi:MAG: hypothetical protein JRF72_13880 [Deltaproteobacteria bacterium]|jgi:hypothetical protein|nr:hypothetical protein [Deltaproteobacteria bacterium]